MPESAQFTIQARCLLDKEDTESLSFASITDLKSLIPESLLKNPNLLPFAGNLWVANLANANGDAVDTETSLSFYKLFEHTKVDLEHFQDKVCGHIISAHFTSFDSEFALGAGSEVLTEEDVKGTKTPFNVAVVGVIYKESAPNVVAKIVESNDVESDKYLSVSLSWECQFSDSHIMLGNSVENSRIVEDPQEKLKYIKYLKSSKGSGKLKDGTPVNRLIYGEVTPMGSGLTLNPAASVKGVIIPDEAIAQYNEEQEEQVKAETEEVSTQTAVITSSEEIISEISSLNENKSSHLENTPVNNNSNKNTKMKLLTSFAEVVALNDETVKEVSLANISAILETKITEVSKEWEAKVAAEKQAVVAAQEKAEAAEKNLAQAQAQIEQLSKSVADLQTAQATAKAEQDFQTRMAGLDSTYELSDEDRTVIAKRIKDLDEAAFTEFANDLKVLFAAKDKEFLKKAKEEKEKGKEGKDGEKKEKKEAKATVEGALENATLEAQVIPNTVAPETNSNDKYKDAFKGIVVQK